MLSYIRKKCSIRYKFIVLGYNLECFVEKMPETKKINRSSSDQNAVVLLNSDENCFNSFSVFL